MAFYTFAVSYGTTAEPPRSQFKAKGRNLYFESQNNQKNNNNKYKEWIRIWWTEYSPQNINQKATSTKKTYHCECPREFQKKHPSISQRSSLVILVQIWCWWNAAPLSWHRDNIVTWRGWGGGGGGGDSLISMWMELITNANCNQRGISPTNWEIIARLCR